MFAMYAIIKSRCTVASLSIAPCTTEFSACRKQIHYIIARSKLLTIEFVRFSRCRKTNMPASTPRVIGCLYPALPCRSLMVNGVRFATHAFLLSNNVRALRDEHGIKGSPCLSITYTYIMSCSFPNKLAAKKKLLSSKEESKSLPKVASGLLSHTCRPYLSFMWCVVAAHAVRINATWCLSIREQRGTSYGA